MINDRLDRTSWSLALAATATMSVSYVDRQSFAVLSPTITRVLGISDTSYGWLVSAFAMAYLVSAPIGGRFINRVGARRGLLLSVLAWSLVAGAHALVPGFAALFMMRLLLGASEAPSFPGAAETVSRVIRPVDRDAAFGILFTGSSFGSMVAPLLCTFLEARFGWRIALLGTAIVGLSWVPLWLYVTRKPATQALLAPRAQPAPEKGQTSWVAMIGDRAVARGLFVIFASAPVLSFAFSWGPKLLVADFGLTQLQVGHYLWLPPVIFDAGAVGFGMLASRRARSRARAGDHDSSARALFFGSLVLTLAAGLVGFGRSPWEATILMGVACAGAGGLYALTTADMMRRVPAAWIAPVGGLLAAIQSLAHVIANPLIGAARDHATPFSTIEVALALWAIPGCLIWLFTDPRPLREAAPFAREEELSWK